MEIDFGQSAANLAAWLRDYREARRAGDLSPTAEARELLALAGRLEKLASDLRANGPLAEAVDQDPPPEIGLDGWPLPRPSRAGTFAAFLRSCDEVAGAARVRAEALPDARERPELAEAAGSFIRLWLECGRDRPALYADGEAVTALAGILYAAGVPLSPNRVRGLLSDALRSFYAFDQDPLYERIATWRG